MSECVSKWVNEWVKFVTWTPNIPNMIKKVQQMRTMFPIGRREDSNVWTTNFKPGALLITLWILMSLLIQSFVN